MISIRYQVFFIDPKQEKPNQLIAVTPTFSSPAAVEALMRALKFEDKKAVIVIGNRDDIEKMLDRVQRLDVVDWGNYDADQRAQALMDLAREFKLEVKEDQLKGPEEGDNQVLGLDPVAITAKVISPPDLPKQNTQLWEDVFEKYRPEIKAGRNEEEREARHRILYKAACSVLNVIPWNNTTVNYVAQQRDVIRNEISRGEDRATALVDRLAKWLVGEDLIKKPRSQKHFDTDFNSVGSKYEITHVIGAKTKKHWDDIAKFLLNKESFSRRGKNVLTLGVDRTTRIDVESSGDDLGFYVVHTMTPQQAMLLTQESEEEKIIKKLNKLVKVWYKVGEVPTLDTID
jgi:hypothetical protein